ncbi:MAG: hypothetical protein Q8M16_03765 [Pirellulaceae bacterium]|nr:hypothetical protein [Pirellulaceae bacterium]
MTHLPTAGMPNLRSFAGRLLAMASLPQDLRAGQVLQVGQKTIVTPEVRDHLRKWQVKLERVTSAVATANTPIVSESVSPWALQIWWQLGTKLSAQSSARQPVASWMGQIDSRIAKDVRQVACSQKLADELAAVLASNDQSLRGPTQLVLSDRPWEVQRRLATKHGVFSWNMPPGGTQVWEQAREAAPQVLLCSPPLTSWIVRQWVALLKRT